MNRDRTRQRDADLGPIADKSIYLHVSTVTGSSRRLRGHHNTSDISTTPAPVVPVMYYEPTTLGLPFSVPTRMYMPLTSQYHISHISFHPHSLILTITRMYWVLLVTHYVRTASSLCRPPCIAALDYY